MYKQYIKQAVQMLRENTLVSVISISGTALAIAMVLVMVLVFQIKSTGYAPESNRSRFMYVWGTEVGTKNPNGPEYNRGGMSSEVGNVSTPCGNQRPYPAIVVIAIPCHCPIDGSSRSMRFVIRTRAIGKYSTILSWKGAPLARLIFNPVYRRWCCRNKWRPICSERDRPSGGRS